MNRDDPKASSETAVATNATDARPWPVRQLSKALSQRDRITGLPVRAAFVAELAQRLAALSEPGREGVLLRIDLDRFAVLNASVGETSGDRVLQEIARRLSLLCDPEMLLGRLGDDEFGLLASVADAAAGEALALAVRGALEPPVRTEGLLLNISASIGWALTAGLCSSDTLLHAAEVALRRAKRMGGDNAQQFHAGRDAEEPCGPLLEAELREAVREDQFVLHYQPRVSCATGEVVGFEALLRWQHPSRGLLSPVEFIDALEQSNLIVEVGGSVLKKACQQVQVWNRARKRAYVVSVNVSARQIQHGALRAQVEAALTETALAPECLELELTESILMERSGAVMDLLRELRTRGVCISIDDFGTGYSSLAYLRTLPVDVLKVDRSFVQDVTAEPDDASITRAIITMGHNLRLKVVAEGVETHGQAALLVANQCDEIQGYLFCRPLTPEGIDGLLDEARRLPAVLTHPKPEARTLLLIDDEPNILAALRRLLRRDGYQILTACSGQEGLDLLAQHSVDVIISDQRMPTMTGVDFLRRAKEMYPHTVRLVLSGYTEFQSITDAINEGAIYRFLTKPWDDSQLRAHVSEAFRVKEMADENRRLQAALSVANKELALVNDQLTSLLSSMQNQIARDSTSLEVAREIIQRVPLPLIGLDEQGDVVLSNALSDRLLARGGSLLGANVEDFAWRQNRPGAGESPRSDRPGASHVVVGERHFVMHRQTMGEHSESRGELLILVPEQPPQERALP